MPQSNPGIPISGIALRYFGMDEYAILQANRKKAMMIYQIKQSELPKKLWNLIDAALRGEPVFIERDDKTLIQLIPLKQMLHPRKAGSARGMLKMSDDFDASLGDFVEYMK